MNDGAGISADTNEPSRGAVAVAAVACIAIAGMLSWRALVGQPPSLWFDVDPASDPFPFAGIAPSTGLILDALTLVCACVAIVSVRRGIDRVRTASSTHSARAQRYVPRPVPPPSTTYLHVDSGDAISLCVFFAVERE